MPFLPITKEDMNERGWPETDVVVVTGDAYVDHPSFGAAIISRVLEAEGYRVCILPQPRSAADFTRFGRPRLGFFITGGNIVVELTMDTGSTVSLQSTMDGVYPFLDAAFSAWCRQKGIREADCPFHDPSKSWWFPHEEE